MERLDRGLIAVPMGGGKAFVSWRLLGNEPQGASFNLYRKTGTGPEVLLTGSPLTTVTSWTDTGASTTEASTYVVKAVVDGLEECAGASFTLPAGAAARQYIPIALAPLEPTANGPFSVLHVYVGDLDGDGSYEYVVKRIDSARTIRDGNDPVEVVRRRLAGTLVVVDAYRLDGTLLWRVNLGPNIETGNSTATSPILVADLDGDGKAEVVMKTGEGTVFGDGTTIGDLNGDGITDYNSHSLDPKVLYEVLNGPEYISVLEGTTGKELARDSFIERGTSTDWGDNYGHRMNFIFATVAYLDGVLPSFVISRGNGELGNRRALTATAWDFRGGKLSQRWTFRAKDHAAALPSGHMLNEFHAIRAMDLDGDGKDDVSWGGFAVGSDGKLLYSTILTHGDRFAIADLDPDRPGLEEYAVQQNSPTLLAAILDARTGAVLQKWDLDPGWATTDVGRGDAAPIVPGQRGLQVWHSQKNSVSRGVWSAVGTAPTQLSTVPQTPYISIWWDGDLLRESLMHTDGNGYNPAIEKWNNTTKPDRLLSIYQDGGMNAVISPAAGRAPLHGADILGDWREEVVFETADHSEIRIYTATAPTDYRLPTLMHDPVYRNCVNVKGYLQSTQVGYYLGEGMTFPVPQPSITVR